MNRAVVHYINKYLSDYLENISSDQLEVSLFSGKISMENVKVKSHVPQLFGLPFDLKIAKLGKINISYSLTSILSKPITIEISEIFAFVTPVESSQWSQSSLRELLIRSKQMTLDQFETLQEAEITETSIPGFLKRWLLQIIDNVQISVEEIYIRYEDSVTATKSFNFGVILNSLKASTCDSNWEKTLNPKGLKFCYKLVEVKSFAVFNDFDVETSIFQNAYAGLMEDMFYMLVFNEMNGDVKHNYIIEPFSIEIKAQINKTFDKTSPIINLQVDMSNFTLSVYDGQIVSAMHILELVKLFLAFLVGVDKTINVKELTEEEEKTYREIYSQYRKAQKNNQIKAAEKLKKKLIELEKEVNCESLIELRTSVVTNIIKSKLIRHKEKEIEKIDNQFRGKWAKFKSAFQKMSELEYMSKEHEVAAKIDEAKKEIQKINDTSVITIAKQKVADDWLKVFVEINIGCVSACMYNEKQGLIKLEIEDIKMVLGLKRGVFIEFHLASTRLKDLFEPHPKFPYFFDMGKVWMYLEDVPLKLEFNGGDIFIYCLTNKMLNVASILKKLFFSKVDISSYALNIQETYREYLESGKDYLNVIFKAGQAAFPDIKVNCKAPVIVFPGNLEKSTDYAVINTGEIVANTLLASQQEVHYYFELKNFEIFIMSNSKYSNKKDSLIALEFISSFFLFNIAEKSIVLGNNIDDIILTLNPESLLFLYELQGKIAKVIPKIMIVGHIKSSFSNMSSSRLKNEGIPVSIQANVRKAYLIVIEGDKEFFEVGASRVSAQINVDKSQQVNMEFKVKEFYLKDLKHASSYLQVFSDPYPKAHDFQILLKILINPETNLTHLTISVGSIRITIFSEFIKALLEYYESHMNILAIPIFNFNVPSDSISYSINTSMHLQMSIMCHRVEVWFPSKESSDCIAFDLATHLDFKQVLQYRTCYSVDGLPASQVLTLKTEEMELLASHMSASLIKTDGLDEPKLFLNPFRALLQIESRTTEIYPVEVLKMKIFVDSMQFCVEIQKIDAFVKLGFDWLFFLMPGLAMQAYRQSELIMDIDCSTVDLTFVSQTEIFEYLGKVEVRKSLVNLTQGEQGLTVKCKSALGIVFFNKKINQWQAVVEDVPVLLDLKIIGEKVDPDVRIYEGMNINVTYELIEVALELLDYFLKDKKLVRHEKIGKEKFVIKNFLDKTFYVWLAVKGNNEVLAIDPKGSLEIDENYIEAIKKYCVSSVKWTYAMEIAQKNIKIGVSLWENRAGEQFIDLQEPGTRVLNFFGEKLLINNSSQGNSRLLSIKSSVCVVDYTGESPEISCLNPGEYEGEQGKEFSSKAGRVSIIMSQAFPTDKPFTLITEHYDAFLDKSQQILLIEIKPEYLIKNSLSEDISIVDQSGVTLQTVKSGVSKPLKVDPKQQYSICFFSVDSTVISSSPSKLLTELNKKSVVGLSYPESSIVLKTKKNDTELPDFLKNFEKKAKNPAVFSQITEVYSEYILTNLSQKDLDISGLILTRNTSAYLSDLSKKIRIRTLKSNSEWSDSFKIDTVGLSGMVIARHHEAPDSYLSVKISQLEGHTKEVKFAPRFLLWNYLNVPISVSQDKSYFKLEPNDKDYAFLDKLNENRTIKISCNEKTWSQEIRVDEINDFQIALKTDPPEHESEKWFLPGFQNNYHRFIRVVILTNDEAILHICFMNPVDPDFRIVNKTEDPLLACEFQSHNKEKLMIPPFESKPWAWSNHLLPKKKVILTLLDSVQQYSIEKVKTFTNKPLSDCSVTVIINGSTRELWVKSKVYSENKARNPQEFFVITKQSSEHTIVNPRFAIKDLVPLPELIENMPTNVVKHIAQKQLVSLTAYLGRISISLFTSDLRQMIGVTIAGLHVKGNLDMYILENKQKVGSKFCVQLKGLQVFSLDSGKAAENILMLKPNRNEEFALTVDFDHEILLKTVQEKVDQRHRVENFDLALGIVVVSINEQSIYSLLEFLDYLHLVQPLLLVNLTNSTDLKEPSLTGLSLGKIYFKSLKIRQVKLLMSIRKAKHKPDFSALSKVFFYPMLRMVGSTFLSEKEVKLEFSQVHILNAFQSAEHFGMVLAKKYISQGIMQFYSVLGFFDLLVNPLKLLEGIGSSVFDYFSEPIKAEDSKSFAQSLQRSVKGVVK